MKTAEWEPEQATVDEVLAHGKGICSGYVPGTLPGEYMEIWQYRGYVFALVGPTNGKTEIHKLGMRWGDPGHREEG